MVGAATAEGHVENETLKQGVLGISFMLDHMPFITTHTQTQIK